MQITLDAQTLLAWVSVLTALGGVLAFMVNLVMRFKKLERHDKSDHETQTVILEALFAVLDGLKQQGCNGPVTEAHKKLREHVIEK